MVFSAYHAAPNQQGWHAIVPAYVRLTKTRNGYAHRLHAIGHLHEAEDESQEFGDLQAAMRAARKAFQTDGTMPDWESLAQAAESARQSAP